MSTHQQPVTIGKQDWSKAGGPIVHTHCIQGQAHTGWMGIDTTIGAEVSQARAKYVQAPGQVTWPHSHIFLLLWLSIPSGFLVAVEKPNRSSFTCYIYIPLSMDLRMVDPKYTDAMLPGPTSTV
jgi:hypothetical protein